jgi:alcohol dehydrogenase class IV
MAANIQALRDRNSPSDILRRYQQVAAWVTGDSQAVPEDGVEWVRRLVRVLNIPGLSAYGIGGADVPGLVAQAMSASSMKANPVALTQQQLAMTLEAAL